MTIMAWILLGLLLGFIASRFLGQEGDRVLPYLVVGVVGAAIGGYLFDLVGTPQSLGRVDMSSVFTAMFGAVVLLGAHHALRGRLFKGGS